MKTVQNHRVTQCWNICNNLRPKVEEFTSPYKQSKLYKDLTEKRYCNLELRNYNLESGKKPHCFVFVACFVAKTQINEIYSLFGGKVHCSKIYHICNKL